MLLKDLMEAYLERPNINGEIDAFLEAARNDARMGTTEQLSDVLNQIERELSGNDPIDENEDYLQHLVYFIEELINNGKLQTGSLYGGGDKVTLASFDRPNVEQMREEVYKWIEHTIGSTEYERANDI